MCSYKHPERNTFARSVPAGWPGPEAFLCQPACEADKSRSADWPGHLRSIAIERVGGRSTTIVGAPLSRGHLWAVNLAGGRTHERDSLAALAPDRDERLTLQARRGNEVRDILQWPQGLVLRNRRKSWLPA